MRNLFREDDFNPSATLRSLPASAESSLFTPARIQAAFNISETEFSNDSYLNGMTSELAARGLYGDYALFIPAGARSTGGSPGLNLEGIEDVLIRFDYVSVAR